VTLPGIGHNFLLGRRLAKVATPPQPFFLVKKWFPAFDSFKTQILLRFKITKITLREFL
jgi:hypothetical protein